MLKGQNKCLYFFSLTSYFVSGGVGGGNAGLISGVNNSGGAGGEFVFVVAEVTEELDRIGTYLGTLSTFERLRHKF